MNGFARAARASGPVVAVESRRQRVRFGSEADLHAADANVRLVPIADFAGPVRVSVYVLVRCAQSKDRPSTLILATTTTASSWSLAKTSLELGAKRKLGTGRASLHSQFPRNPRDKIPLRKLGDSGKTRATTPSGRENIVTLRRSHTGEHNSAKELSWCSDNSFDDGHPSPSKVPPVRNPKPRTPPGPGLLL